MNQKMRQKAMFSLLSEKLKDKQMIFVTGLEKLKGKTKEAIKFLKNLKIENKKVLFVLPEKLEKLELSLRNIEKVSYEKVNLINIYEVANADQIVFLKEAVGKIK